MPRDIWTDKGMGESVGPFWDYAECQRRSEEARGYCEVTPPKHIHLLNDQKHYSPEQCSKCNLHESNLTTHCPGDSKWMLTFNENDEHNDWWTIVELIADKKLDYENGKWIAL